MCSTPEPAPFSVEPRMSSSYRALLQSLDETDDVSRGLGRRIKPKRPRSCCARCCSSPVTKWLCVALCLVVGLAMSIVIPLMIALPQESQWHVQSWFRNWSYFSSSNSSHSTEDLRNNATLPEGEPRPEADVSGNNNSTSKVATFLNETVRQWKLMTEWMRERYGETPKVPLFIGLAIPLVGFIIIMWVVIYRKVKRRQRRRALGKLVTDLQSGKTLLSNSDDSEDE